MLDIIYSKITAKGWNPYQITDKSRPNDYIPNGSAESFIVGKQYLLLPQVEDHTSVEQIQKAQQYMQSQGTFPLFRHNGELLPLAFFGINQEDILVHGVRDVKIPHDELSRDLDSLVSLTGIN